MPGWMERLVGLAAALVLAGLPIAATTCAILCAPPTTVTARMSADATHHHHSPAPADHHSASTHGRVDAQAEHQTPERQSTLSPRHGCDTHDGRDGEPSATIAAGRPDTIHDPGLHAQIIGPAALDRTATPRTHVGSRPPLDRSLTHTRVVLRI